MITFIVPIRNEEKFIRGTLESILNQTSSEKIEILVADGMSNDSTIEILNVYIKKYPQITLIKNYYKIVPIGFNKALSISKGEIIIRVDGHSIIDPNFVKNCLNVFKSTGANCVGGATEHISKGIVGNSITVAQSSKFGVGSVSFRSVVEKGHYTDTLAFGAYKRDVFNDIGGYDEELARNQDDEFNFRLIQNGGKIWIDPSIKSKYYNRNSITKLFKQYFQYGFFKVRVIQKRRAIASWRQIVPSFFVLAIIISIIFIYFFNSSLPLFMILGFYLTANIISTLYETIRTDYKLLVLLPIIYFVLHIAYGLGFISGLLYFITKWSDTQLKDFNFNKNKFNLIKND